MFWGYLKRADRRVLLGMALALGASASYASSQVIGRFVVTRFTTPLVASSFALLFGNLFVFLLSVREIGSVRFSRRGLLFMGLAGLASGAGATLILFAVDRAPVVEVAPVASINPLLALLFSALFIRRLEVFTPRLVAGTLLVVAGIITVVLGSTL